MTAAEKAYYRRLRNYPIALVKQYAYKNIRNDDDNNQEKPLQVSNEG